jgi:rhamnosyltransferase
LEKFKDNTLTISIVIPVKNGVKTIEDCLSGIKQQTLFDRCEVIIIDSGSTDGTLELLKKYEVRLHQIPAEEFNHGATRNYGVSLAKGEFVVMTVQDAVPSDDQWLEKMIRHFEDPEVAGACGQQIVPHHPDKNPHQWFRPISSPKTKKIKFCSAEEFDALSPRNKKISCSWDDVNAMYRRATLEKIPFRNTAFAEDALWAIDALRAGKTLVYDFSIRINHYHFLSRKYTYQRVLTQLYYDYKIFRYRRTYKWRYSEILKVIFRNFKFRAHPKWVTHNIDIYKAKHHAYQDFQRMLDQGESALDSFYEKICKTPPQAGQNIKT